MQDSYYSAISTSELKNMKYSDIIKNSFLVRKVIDDTSTKIELIYKDKVVDENNNVISEQKVKVKLDDYDKALEIFKLSNLNLWCEINQDMTVYAKDKIVFILQEVDGLGNYIEYEEDDYMANMSEYEKIELMLNNLKTTTLKLGNDYSCKKVYLKFLKNISE